MMESTHHRHLIRVRLYNDSFFPKQTKVFVKFVDEVTIGPIALHQVDESDDRLYCAEVEVDVAAPSTLHLSIYMVKDGKEIFDVVEKKALKWKTNASALDNVTKNIKRLSMKKAKDKEKDKDDDDAPQFIMCEWMWNTKASILRICSVEPRILPQVNATLVVCVAQVKDLAEENVVDGGAGRGRGRGIATSDMVVSGRGMTPRGRGELGTMKGTGRGAPGTPETHRTESTSPRLSDVRDTLKRNSDGARGPILAETLTVFDGLRQLYPMDHHLIMVLGGWHGSQEPLSEEMRPKLLQEAKARSVFISAETVVAQTVSMNNTAEMINSVRWFASKGGFGKIIWVLHQSDVERVTLAWTETRGPITIQFSLHPVPD